MKIKVCGITNLGDALIAESFGADAIGFIFYEKSKRYISPGQASEIIKHLSPFTAKVGVFVNENQEKINDIFQMINLSLVQLHGDETPEYCKHLNLPAIKSFRINGYFDFTLLDRYKNVSYLLDTFSEEGYGGTGKSFDWEIIPGEIKNKIILAGGISAKNISEIYNNIKPAAVDISSSLESTPGKKDKEKVKEFFKTINYLRR